MGFSGGKFLCCSSVFAGAAAAVVVGAAAATTWQSERLKNYAQKRVECFKCKNKSTYSNRQMQNKRNKSRGKSPMLSGRHLAVVLFGYSTKLVASFFFFCICMPPFRPHPLALPFCRLLLNRRDKCMVNRQLKNYLSSAACDCRLHWSAGQV